MAKKPDSKLQRILEQLRLRPPSPPPPPERSHFEPADDKKEARRARPQQQERARTPARSTSPAPKAPPVEVRAEFEKRMATTEIRNLDHVNNRFKTDRGRETGLAALENAAARHVKALEEHSAEMYRIKLDVRHFANDRLPVYEEVAAALRQQQDRALAALDRERKEIDQDLAVELAEIEASELNINIQPQLMIEHQPDEPPVDGSAIAMPAEPVQGDWLDTFREAARSEPGLGLNGPGTPPAGL